MPTITAGPTSISATSRGGGALCEADQKLNLGELLVKDLGRMAPEFLIVTVPEPIDSRFGYRFDAILDAVQYAIETQGWNLERFWLPWWPSGRQFADRSVLKSVISAGTKVVLHERKPGVLLFRQPRNPPEEDLFPVGDTLNQWLAPITGVLK